MRDDFNILIVDDEPAYCEVLSMILRAAGYQATCLSKSAQAPALVKTGDFQLVISDLIMPEMDGITLLKAVRRLRPDVFFLITTAYGTIENAVEAMKHGAFGYLIKGSDPEEMLREVAQIKKLCERGPAGGKEGEGGLLLASESRVYQQVLNLARKAAASDANILILGESGSGKEILAQYIHRESSRAGGRFLATNCHSFADSLLESELFGHEKGAFTGALNAREGLFEAARGGTLFLDEIGDISLATQAKLLRAVETKRISRIGSNQEIHVDFRLISATNRDIDAEGTRGDFREDLYYRIGTIILRVPPLRERREDIPRFIAHFLSEAERKLGAKRFEFDEAAERFLLNYSWPGNVRELKNAMERLVVLSDGDRITMDAIAMILPVEGAGKPPEGCAGATDAVSPSLKELRNHYESAYIRDLLLKHRNEITAVAQVLGITPRHLRNKIAEYGLDTGAMTGEGGPADGC
jgi:DNA-binding NtrC family response regulator